MVMANADLMARRDAESPVETPKPSIASRTWSNAVGDAISFALVGVAAVGFVVESLDIATDNTQGVLEVTAGAAVGAAASFAYARIETSRERAARVRSAAWTAIRLFLAFELVRYGVAKVVGMQFYERYYRLDMRAGDMTPMALAWTFFGRSYGYQAISGVLEIAAAALLCFRRTAAFGACMLLAVMTNVVLVDFFYDVPVKLFSTIYVVMALCVLAPDARRFWTFFFGDGPVPPRAYLAPTASTRSKRFAIVSITALALVLPAADIVHKAMQRGVFHTDVLEGAWKVERRVGLDDLLATNGAWDKVYFEKGDYGFVRIGEQRVPFKVHVDEAGGTVRLFEIGGGGTGGSRELWGTFEVDRGSVRIEGTRDGTVFSLEMTRDRPR